MAALEAMESATSAATFTAVEFPEFGRLGNYHRLHRLHHRSRYYLGDFTATNKTFIDEASWRQRLRCTSGAPEEIFFRALQKSTVIGVKWRYREEKLREVEKKVGQKCILNEEGERK